MRRGWAVAVLVAVAAPSIACRSVPPSLPDARDELRAWVDSGGYARRLEGAVAPARHYLDRRWDDVERPAIVLDVDETSLSSWAYQNDHGFCYSSESFHAWVATSTPPPIEATLELYRAARGLDVAVFFVTGRHEPLRAETERTLVAAGYREWERLVMRPVMDEGDVAAYKSAARRAIEAEGFTILVNVGDQASDLAGGHAERRVLLPNPFYRID